MNIQKMMQQAQKMQEKMGEMQEQLAQLEVSGTSGGGLVTVTITCKGLVKGMKIDPSIIDPDEKEVMEDLITAALNDARSKADVKMAEETEKAMAELGIPAGMLGGGGLPF